MIIYIPIRGPELVIEPSSHQIEKEYIRFLDDFDGFSDCENLRKLVDDKDEYQNFKTISFSILYSSVTTAEEADEIGVIREKYNFFKTEFISEFLKINLNNVEGREIDDLFAEIIANSLIEKLSLLINLTYSTKIDFLLGIIFSGEGKYLGKTKVLLSSIDFAYEHSFKIGWPVIKPLGLGDTTKWFVSNSLHTDDISKNRLHRAINAFSYQFSSLGEKDTSILFWTMLGIEALLADGSTNIIGQIKTKSSIILGQPIDYKKKLDKLYNYRSRFVHGDIDFPAKFSSDFETFEDEYWDYLHFASSILLALIRTLVLVNKNEFVFEYKLKEYC